MDYNNTLNLPKTEFPMRGNLPKREPETLNKWENDRLYYKMTIIRISRSIFFMTDLLMLTVRFILALLLIRRLRILL